MKGIILSGGTGSRLYPMTQVVNKQLLPVYDKPMIYYPMSTLISMGINDICIISSPSYIDSYKTLFSDGSRIGLNINYKIQPKPSGIAQSFIIAEKFIGSDSVCLILGDNIFHGNIPQIKNNFKSTIFAYYVNNPREYGVIEFDSNGKAISIEEKPTNPKSKYAVPGLYIYDNSVISVAKSLRPSNRGELEITDINKYYLNNQLLGVIQLDRGFVWLDAGSSVTLQQASNYIQTIQDRQGIKIGCIEEESYKSKFIDKKKLIQIINNLPKSEYRNYLETLI